MGIETLLLGAAATGATATTAATAATAGLFGAGGAFSLGSTLATLSGLGSIFSGLQGMQAGKQQAEMAKAQAAMSAKEQVRLSAREAQMEAEAADDVRRRQKLAFMASGVSLQGSPLLVMEETRRKGAENVAEIMTSGGYSSAARLQEGRIMATNAKASGRQAFMSGLTNAAGSFAKMAG